VGGDGDDQIDASDGGSDLIDCGAGIDFVHMDAGDAASAECEQTLVDVALQIPARGLRAGRDGIVRIPLACPAAAAAGCGGWVTLARAGGRLNLGIGSYVLAKGDDVLVEIELSRKNFALLKKKKVLTVTATGFNRDSVGRTSSTSSTFKLLPPKAAKKKKKKAKPRKRTKRRSLRG
jgi:hypothetical protein